MKTPDPKLDRAETLFAAARGERPDPAIRERARALAEAGARAPHSHSGVRPIEPTAAARPRVLPSAPAGWMLAGMLAAACGVLALLSDAREAQPAQPGDAYPVAPEQPATPMQARRSLEAKTDGPESALVAPVPAPAAAFGPRASGTAESEAGARPEPGPSAPLGLQAELQLLDRARAALARGEHKQALAWISRHQRAGGDKQLQAEAAVLRIEANAAAGHDAEASRLARQFLEHNENSALADRVRMFIASPPSRSRATEGVGP